MEISTNAAISVFTTMALLLFTTQSRAQSYSEISRLYEDKLGSASGYKTMIRPVLDHSKVTEVNVTFDILAIVEVEAIKQRFVTNGYLGLHWQDELLVWNYTDYDGIIFIHPEPKQIWRPRVVLTNTVESRDIFEDNYSPTVVWLNGRVSWFPGSLFPTSCKLNLYKYPFDEQECMIEMYSMGLGATEINFVSHFGVAGTQWFTSSGEWTIEGTELEASDPGFEIPFFKVKFKLKRLPGFFIVNIVTPIVLMSFLNILVFLIPVDSGEKISYGITVLLALTVFMSIVSEQLPRSSDTLPMVTIYLLVLTIISVCTVIVSVVIVYFHHRDEKEVKHQKATADFKSAFHKVSILNRAAKNFAKVQQVAPASTSDKTQYSDLTGDRDTIRNCDAGTTKNKFSETVFNVLGDVKEETGDKAGDEMMPKDGIHINRWRQIGKHLDTISFLVFTAIWVSVTIGFLIEMAR